MSLILDALRKMEQERKSRLGTTGDLRPEVLRYRAAAQPRRVNTTLVGGVAVALLAVGVVAGVVWHRARQGAPTSAPMVAQTAPVQSVSAPVAAPAQAPLPVSAAAVPQVAPVTPPAPAPQAAPQPSAARQAAAQPAPPRPAASQPALPASATAVPSAGGIPEQRTTMAATPAVPERSRARKSARTHTAAETLQAAPADVTVSGIAWQEERAMRRAVVNGSLVGEGAEVAGARVVEIREDRVRFSRSGQSFEVPYTSNLGSR